MRHFLKKQRHFVCGWAFVAILPLSGCSTVTTTAFTPIVLPNGCAVGDNYPNCKSLNATCSTPMSVESSDYSYYDSPSASQDKLSNCKNLFTSCMDELASSGFVGKNKGQCVPQLISTTNIQGTLRQKNLGDIWYLNCNDDKTSGIKTFEAAVKGMKNSMASASDGNTFVVGSTDNGSTTPSALNYVTTNNSGVARACTTNLSSAASSSNLGISQFCVSDFGSNVGNYQSSLGSQTQSSVDYQNLPSTPTCKPLPPNVTPPTANTPPSNRPTSTATPFTGVTVGVGYTHSSTQVNGSTLTGSNGTISVGYTIPQNPITVAGRTVIPTIGVRAGMTLGPQSSVPGTPGVTTHYDEYYEGPIIADTAGTADTHPISNTTAIVVQPGLIINNQVQVFANVGGVTARTQDNAGNSSQETGTRIGVGAGVALTSNLSLNVQGNSDNIAGTRSNSVGVGVSFAL